MDLCSLFHVCATLKNSLGRHAVFVLRVPRSDTGKQIQIPLISAQDVFNLDLMLALAPCPLSTCLNLRSRLLKNNARKNVYVRLMGRFLSLTLVKFLIVQSVQKVLSISGAGNTSVDRKNY